MLVDDLRAFARAHPDAAIICNDAADILAGQYERSAQQTSLLESQAKALSEANDHIQQLQRALSFWMPGVTEASDIETNGRVADDAYLLMGYNGPISDDCWGDRTHKRALAAEARLAEAMKMIEPFAKAGELFDPRDPDGYDQCIYGPAAGDEYSLKGDHLRAARAFTNAAKEKT